MITHVLKLRCPLVRIGAIEAPLDEHVDSYAIAL